MRQTRAERRVLQITFADAGLTSCQGKVGSSFNRTGTEEKAGCFRATHNDLVMEKVDSEGNVIGFSVLRVSSLKKTTLEVALR